MPTSAQIFSPWIFYDPSLHIKDAEYTITVSDINIFNSFIVRPRVCDWLSQCTDVIQTAKPQAQVQDGIKSYQFKFNRFKNSKYIKLVFYIEYFQPIKETEPFEVKFDLKLKHFGDPCFLVDECRPVANPICNSDVYDDSGKWKPNILQCECPNGYTGTRCEFSDRCLDTKVGDVFLISIYY
jgi:hypothetical protein